MKCEEAKVSRTARRVIFQHEVCLLFEAPTHLFQADVRRVFGFRRTCQILAQALTVYQGTHVIILQCVVFKVLSDPSHGGQGISRGWGVKNSHAQLLQQRGTTRNLWNGRRRSPEPRLIFSQGLSLGAKHAFWGVPTFPLTPVYLFRTWLRWWTMS